MEEEATAPAPHLRAAAGRVVLGCRGNEEDDDMAKTAPATTTPMTGEGTGGQAQHPTPTTVNTRSQGGSGANARAYHTVLLTNEADVLGF